MSILVMTDAVISGVHFDGSAWLIRPSGLTGVTDSKQGTLSLWLRHEGVMSGQSWAMPLMGETSGAARTYFQKGNGGTLLRLQDGIGVISSGGPGVMTPGIWRHILISVDVSTSTLDIYVDDVDHKLPGSFANRDIPWGTNNTWSIGALPSTTGQWFVGDLAEMYLMPGVYFNLSVEANRRKFLTADGQPADLGSDGSLPTGTAPPLYMRANGDQFTNAGTGGDFTLTGILTESTTLPQNLILDTADLWFDATLDVDQISNRVSSWGDHSGNGRHATQSAAADRPYFDSTVNGLTAMRYAASRLSAAPYTYDRTNCRIFTVLRPTSLNADRYYLSRWNGDGIGAEFAFGITAANKFRNIYYGASGGGGTALGTSTAVSGQTYLIEGGLSGGTADITINGTLEHSISMGAEPLTSGTRDLYIGALNEAATTRRWAGEICEVIMTSGETDPEPIRTYLAAKWGVTLA